MVSFLSTRQELLFNMDSSARGFPTPRSWEMVSDILSSTNDHKGAQDIILGAIGEAATIEFIGFMDTAISEATILKIIEDPEKAKLPNKLGDQYALIAYLTGRVKEQKVLDAAGGILLRLKPELGVLLFRNLLQKQPKFALNKNAKAFIKTHKDLIQ